MRFLNCQYLFTYGILGCVAPMVGIFLREQGFSNFQVAIALAILIAWPIFFTQFHQLLFPPETWTFAYSDSLIRLFPEQFWFDIGVLVSVGTLVLGVLVTLVGYFMSRRGANEPQPQPN